MISREGESSVRIQIQHFFYFHGTDNNFKPSMTCAFNISEENRIKLILCRKVSSQQALTPGMAGSMTSLTL